MGKVIPPVPGTIRFPLPQATIYTDGSCWPNPGPGAWGAVIKQQFHATPIEISGVIPFTTVSRMELQAAISALRSLAGHTEIKLFSDSKYLIEGITVNIYRWVMNGWKTDDGEQVKNFDLWAELFYATSYHLVKWEWRPRNSLPEMNRAHDLAHSARLRLIETMPKIDAPVSVTLNAPPVLLTPGVINITTAASCSGNPGPGAWACILNFNGQTKEIAGQEKITTSNRMQLMAAIQGLEAIRQPLPVIIYTNSEYLIGGVTRPIYSAMPNFDLWQRLNRLIERYKPIFKHEASPDSAAAKKLAKVTK